MKPLWQILSPLKLKCQACVFITVFFFMYFIEQTKCIPKYVKIQKQQPEPIAAYIIIPSYQCFYINKYNHIQPVSPSGHWLSSCIIALGKKRHGTCVRCGLLKLDVQPSFNPLLNNGPILTHITAAEWLLPTLTLFIWGKSAGLRLGLIKDQVVE